MTTISADLTFNARAIRKRFAEAGFKKFEAVVVPPGWSSEFDRDPDMVPLLAANVARFLGCSVMDVLADRPLPSPDGGEARFFRAKDTDAGRMSASTHLARKVAGAAVRARRAPNVEIRLPPDAATWRRELLAAIPDGRSGPSLAEVVEDLWARGVVVLHLPKLPVGKPFGMALFCDRCPVVILSKDTDNRSEHAFIAVHEAAHLALGHCTEGMIVDMKTEGICPDEVEEKEADAWSWRVLLGNNRPRLPDSEDDHPPGVDPYALAWVWGLETGRFPIANGRTAQWGQRDGARRVLAESKSRHLDMKSVSWSDARLLSLLG